MAVVVNPSGLGGSGRNMRVFIAEFVCGGGVSEKNVDEIPGGLRREGHAMLSALVEDASRVADIVVPVDPRLAPAFDGVSNVTPFRIDPLQPLWPQWIKAAADCDAAIVVAPESNGILAKGVAMLRAGGLNVIAGSGDFLRVASDKVQTARVLHAASVNHPDFIAVGERKFVTKMKKFDQFVVKPRDGCGTQQVQRFDSFDTAMERLDETMILQHWCPGRAVSVSLIATGNRHFFLPAVAQELHNDSCEYQGGCGPLCDDDQRRAMALASRVIEAMPPTAKGFIGFDLLLGERPSEDVVIEVNPRLTTSYVGLRRMTNANLAARILDVEHEPIACQVGVGQVHWSSEGDVTLRDDAVMGSAGGG